MIEQILVLIIVFFVVLIFIPWIYACYNSLRIWLYLRKNNNEKYNRLNGPSPTKAIKAFKYLLDTSKAEQDEYILWRKKKIRIGVKISLISFILFVSLIIIAFCIIIFLDKKGII